MPKIFQDKIRHIFDEEQNAHFTFCEKRPILYYKVLTVSCFYEKSLIQCCRAATGRVINRLPSGPLMRPSGSWTGCLRAAGFMKTPGELGAASSTHPRPYGLLKLSRRPWNRLVAGRAAYGYSQNIHFYSPYGTREWFVKAPFLCKQRLLVIGCAKKKLYWELENRL